MCRVPECGRPESARGYCSRHYYRFMRYGDPEGTFERKNTLCSVGGCGRKAIGRGWCSAHYYRWKRTGSVGEAAVNDWKTASLSERLARHIDRGDPRSCWEWTGHRNEHGYGILSYQGKNRTATRLVWAEENGPIPAGGLICHHCDNPPCCNPAHLYLGDLGTNGQDMAARKRHPRIKLTPALVRHIRRELEVKTSQQVALETGVNYWTVRDVATRTWQWVD